MNRIQTVQHHGVLVGMRLFLLIGERLGMRSMMDAARMQRGHTSLYVVFAKEVAIVIEDELVVIRVAMEERDAHGVVILLERTRQETADHSTLRDKSGVSAGRQMRAMAHHRTDVAHVDLPYGEIAFPTDHVDDQYFSNFKIDPNQLRPIGRMGGATYTRTTDRFDMPRPE